jgi:hypothetical protein
MKRKGLVPKQVRVTAGGNSSSANPVTMHTAKQALGTLGAGHDFGQNGPWFG